MKQHVAWKPEFVADSGGRILFRLLTESLLKSLGSSKVAWIRQGVLDPTAEPELKEITLVVAQVDGKNGSKYGQDVWYRYGVGETLQPLWYVSMSGQASFGCRLHVPCVYQLFVSVTCLRREIKTYGGFAYRLRSSRKQTRFHPRYGAIYCSARQDLQSEAR